MKTTLRKPFRRADSISSTNQPFEEAPIAILSPGMEVSDPNDNESGGVAAMSRSEQKLADMGYKQEFKREMTLLGVVGLSLTSVSSR